MISKFEPKNPKAWILRRPWLARVAALTLIATCWAWFPVIALWEVRKEFAAVMAELISIAFLPWRTKKGHQHE